MLAWLLLPFYLNVVDFFSVFFLFIAALLSGYTRPHIKLMIVMVSTLALAFENSVQIIIIHTQTPDNKTYIQTKYVEVYLCEYEIRT